MSSLAYPDDYQGFNFESDPEEHDAKTETDDDDKSGTDEKMQCTEQYDQSDVTWVWNVGINTYKPRFQFHGDDLVDLILRGEKTVKYMSPMYVECRGPKAWIVLREIWCRNPANNNRVRCAIQVDPIPLEGDEWKREEWGWFEEGNEAKLNKTMKTKNKNYIPGYLPYKITAVRAFGTEVTTLQTQQGAPWEMRTDMQYAEESSLILSGLANSVPMTCRVIRKAKKKSFHDYKIREQKQQAKAAKREQITYYFDPHAQQAEQQIVCCQKRVCMDVFQCGQVDFVEDTDHINTIQWFRRKFQELTAIQQRKFIVQRLTSRDPSLGIHCKQFFLEPLEVMVNYVQQAQFPLIPACDPSKMIPVCRKFFEWCLRISHNKIDQPTMGGGKFNVEMHGKRVPRYYDHSTAECIKSWLKAFAAPHEHDPTSTQIVLYCATRQQVYDCYAKDFLKESEQKFFPRTRDESHTILPKIHYFCKVWITSGDTKHIKVRRYLPHAKCDECMRYARLRRNVQEKKARRIMLIHEKHHHQFVHGEKASYYTRRKQAIYQSKKYFSLMIDGATQAVLALPHMVQQDKTTAEARKVPIHMFLGLLHGRRAYSFVCTDNFKHGSNITIECIHRILTDVYSQDKALPPTFYVQMDNTAKQCKNRYIIGYLALLVQWNLVQNVVLSFLPVGHTHEDGGQILFCLRLFRGARFLNMILFSDTTASLSFFMDVPTPSPPPNH